MTIQIVLINEYGEFYGEHLKVTVEQYSNIIEMSKNFYETGFEMSDEDGGFLIIPPEIVKKSILKVKILEENV
jgi:hypothetical protein